MTSEIARFDAITGLSCLLCTAVLLEEARVAGGQVLGTGTALCLRRAAVVTSTSSDNTDSHSFTPSAFAVWLRFPSLCRFYCKTAAPRHLSVPIFYHKRVGLCVT